MKTLATSLLWLKPQLKSAFKALGGTMNTKVKQWLEKSKTFGAEYYDIAIESMYQTDQISTTEYDEARAEMLKQLEQERLIQRENLIEGWAA